MSLATGFRETAAALLLIFCFVMAAAFRAEAAWPELDGTVQAEGAILIDADSSAVLYAKNEHEHYYPASITKVLTAVIVLEHAENLDDMVTFSYDATNTNLEANSTVIGAIAGDRLSVRDCLYGLLLHSANDCANALAEYVSGSNEAFAELMNQKAAELGCTDSHFANPSGLNNPDHYTSCADMAKIMQYAIKNPTFREIESAQSYTHGPLKIYPDPSDTHNTIYAHHHMMRKSFAEYYPGVFAGKTGYTILAGNTLLTACERDGMTLIAAILNGHKSQYRDTKLLFDFGFDEFNSRSLASGDTPYSALKSNLKVDGMELVDSLEFTMDDGDHITLPKDAEFSDVESTISYDLKDEEKQDGSIARAFFRYEGHDVGDAYIRLEKNDSLKPADPADAPLVEQAAEETVPESIPIGADSRISETESDRPSESTASHAPLIFDKEKGRIIIQTPILLVLLILAGIAAIAAFVFLVYYFLERHETNRYIRKRNRILKNTSDFTLKQKEKRDLLLSEDDAKRRRRRRRRF